jgi:bacillithiol system protein YtxJ
MIDTLSGQDHAERLIAGPAPAWILKHSSTCPISSAALDEVEAYLAAHPGELAAMVVVQADRPLSNWLAQRLGRVHQSPQLFLVAGGQVRWAASHWSITAAAMAAERALI